MKISDTVANPFESCPGLRRAFTTRVDACGKKLLPDYVIVDRSSPKWQWDEIKLGMELGIIEEDFVEIDEQETQLRYRLSKAGQAAVSAEPQDEAVRDG